MEERAELRITVEHPHVEAVGGLHQQPSVSRARAAILLAHGAGAPMDSEFMNGMADALVGRGFCVLRFNYPYAERMRREGRRLPPDRLPVLEATHERALVRVRELHPELRVIAAGKSMGGRVASVIAAKGAALEGLAYFGYPWPIFIILTKLSRYSQPFPFFRC
jgi:predicted alpha/beta-hydrolase family hydrolase